jgi:hypothetical protein
MSVERAELGLQVIKGRKRIWLASLVIVLCALLVLPLGYRAYEQWIFAANVQKLHVGDTKERVQELLGPPRWRFAKGSQLSDALRKQNLLLWLVTPESPETWVYGSWRLIWLAPGPDDWAIEFDNTGRVVRLVRPGEPRNYRFSAP